MAHFIIEGGHPLSGTHRPAGNKNAALPMLAASVLADSPVVLHNLPLIRDVKVMLELLESLGARVDLDATGHSVRIDPAGLTPRPLDRDLCRRVRASILFAGPLAARFGEAVIPSPGGDGIGRRRLDTHFEGLRGLGIEVTETNPYVFRRGRELRGASLLLDEASVTATENLLMAAVLARGETTLYNAACEPHVQDLCHMLRQMGARIEGIGTNRLRIEGAERLRGVEARVGPDAVEAASFLAAVAATHGSLRLEDVPREEFEIIRRPFARLGVRWTLEPDGSLRLPAVQELRVQNDADNAIPKIEDGIWPSVPSDLLSVLIVLATCAHGIVLFFEKMFESRLYFVDHLIGMGARIVQCDPHRILVHGPSVLHGTRVSSPDIRAGMALLVAALKAEGRTEIHNAESIDRGYESIERSLAGLGARIERQA